MLSGTASGALVHHECTDDGRFELRPEPLYDASPVEVPQSAAPILVDLDGDGQLTLCVPGRARLARVRPREHIVLRDRSGE
jgi:hypothetical protein